LEEERKDDDLCMKGTAIRQPQRYCGGDEERKRKKSFCAPGGGGKGGKARGWASSRKKKACPIPGRGDLGRRVLHHRGPSNSRREKEVSSMSCEQRTGKGGKIEPPCRREPGDSIISARKILFARRRKGNSGGKKGVASRQNRSIFSRVGRNFVVMKGGGGETKKKKKTHTKKNYKKKKRSKRAREKGGTASTVPKENNSKP